MDISRGWLKPGLCGPQDLSGGLDQRCRAQAGAAGRRGTLYPLQQDPGSGNVTPGHPQAWLQLPTDAPGHVVGNLKWTSPLTLNHRRATKEDDQTVAPSWLSSSPKRRR